MADIASVIRSLREDGSIYQAANSPRLSFLDANDRVLVGAQLLPEVQQPYNRYDEEDFYLVDVVADDTDRYSPVKFKGEAIELAAFEVTLGESGMARQLSPAAFDALVRLLADGSQVSMDQMAQNILDFVGSNTRGLSARNEIQRWQALVNGEVTRVVGGRSQTIVYPSATGQRTALANAWSGDAYDPYDDLSAAADFAADMGYGQIVRAITSRKSLNILARNQAMSERAGGYVEGPEGRTYGRRASAAQVNQYLVSDLGFSIEAYDAMYTEEQDGTRVRQRYLPEDAIVFVFDSGEVNESALELAEQDDREYIPPETPGSLGYVGVGTVSGHQGPGKQVKLASNEEDTVRPHVKSEAAQTSLPVIRQANGFLTYTGIR